MTRDGLVRSCGWLGLGLVALYVVASLRSGPNMSELLWATQPVVRIPLETLRSAGRASVVFRVPETKQWERLRREWGEPHYLVFAYRRERSSHYIQPFGELDLAVRATSNGETLVTERASDAPYSYSSRTTDVGIVFRGMPGAEIRLDVEAKDAPSRRDGEFVVEPQWPGSLKDRIVGAMLEESAAPYVTGAGIVGVLLVFAALSGVARRPGSSPRTPAPPART